MNGAEKLKCFDVCCGAGALSHGFHMAGAEILGGIDIDKSAVETAQANYRRASWEVISIQDFAQKVDKNAGHPIWDANTLLAGLPCQGFSCAGKRDPDDPRNSLYRHLVGIASKVEPNLIVVENVPGILKARNAATYRALCRGLQKLGYDVDERTLQASDFGVPQLRKRVFVIGCRSGSAAHVFEAVCLNGQVPTVRHAFRGLPSTRQKISLSHEFMVHGRKVTAKLRKLKPGGPISYRRLVWGEPAPTLVAGHRALPVHPEQPRAISVREAARLQGFKDSYIFCGSRSSQIEQVANAVPPPLAAAVASAIRRAPDHAARARGGVYGSLKALSTAALGTRLADVFLATFRDGGRSFPWRSTTRPFKILVTELLLQRTKAELASRVWHDVLALLPTAWVAGRVDLRRLRPLVKRIGIVSRAHALKKLGKVLWARHRGRVPEHFDELVRLPGVGIYVASAVRVFSFGRRDFPVDSNAFRFASRYFGIDLAGRKNEARQIREFMCELMPEEHVDEYVYGFLDFAAQVCRPTRPACGSCALAGTCKAR